MAIFVELSLNHIEKGRLDGFGDGSNHARPDGPIIHLPDGSHLGRRSREKGFMGRIELISRKSILDDGPALRLGYVNN